MKTVHITQPPGRRDIELANVIFFGETVRLQYNDANERLPETAAPVLKIYDKQNNLVAKSGVFVKDPESTRTWFGEINLDTDPLFLEFGKQSPCARIPFCAEFHCPQTPSVVGKGGVLVGNNAKAINNRLNLSGGGGSAGGLTQADVESLIKEHNESTAPETHTDIREAAAAPLGFIFESDTEMNEWLQNPENAVSVASLRVGHKFYIHDGTEGAKYWWDGANAVAEPNLSGFATHQDIQNALGELATQSGAFLPDFTNSVQISTGAGGGNWTADKGGFIQLGIHVFHPGAVYAGVTLTINGVTAWAQENAGLLSSGDYTHATPPIPVKAGDVVAWSVNGSGITNTLFFMPPRATAIPLMEVDTVPTPGSPNLVTSGGVSSAVLNKMLAFPSAIQNNEAIINAPNDFTISVDEGKSNVNLNSPPVDPIRIGFSRAPKKGEIAQAKINGYFNSSSGAGRINVRQSYLSASTASMGPNNSLYLNCGRGMNDFSWDNYFASLTFVEINNLWVLISFVENYVEV